MTLKEIESLFKMLNGQKDDYILAVGIIKTLNKTDANNFYYYYKGLDVKVHNIIRGKLNIVPYFINNG